MPHVVDTSPAVGKPERPTVVSKGEWTIGSILLVSWLILLLAGGIVLQWLPHPKTISVERPARLEEYFPEQMAGWRGENQALGPTEDIAAIVKSTLSFDEALLRTYRKDGREFSIYVAYWSAGKMSSREVAYHTPDICWPANGGNCVAADHHYRVDVLGKPLAPAQNREFDFSGRRVNALFWHIYNGRTIAYDPLGRPSRFSMLTDLWQRGLNQRGEQYFIRFTSEENFETLLKEPGFQEILELIAPLGPGLHPELETFELSL